jgi:HEPN domain-containing protein
MASSHRPHPEEAAPSRRCLAAAPQDGRPSRRTHGARPGYRVPRDLLGPVVEHFKPQRVILFGSRARGDATRDSDIDLLVVVDDDTPPDKLGWKAGHEAHHSRHAADVFSMRAEIFERDRAIANTLAAEADADGVVVYGSPKGTCMRAPDPQARWNAVERWLRVAERDRRMVVAAVESDPPMTGGAAFHCQQALEKLLKGFLTLAGKRGGKTHSLEQLGALAQQSFPEIADLVAAASGWSDWVHVYRYPEEDAPPEPDEAEIRAALEVIDALAARLRANQPQN